MKSYIQDDLLLGRPHGKEVSRKDACRDPATRDLYIHNIRKLRELTNVFMLTIESNVAKIPFGIRYIARQIFHCIKVPSTGDLR